MVTCPDPDFPWDALHGWYQRCTRCGRLAWDHEQADPLADVRNDYLLGPGERPKPPVMKTVPR